MRFNNEVPVQWISDFIEAKLIGNEQQLCTGLNEIHKVEAGDITFVDIEKYYEKCLNSNATIIIINKEVACPEGKTLLVTGDPFSAYVKLVKHFRPFESSNQMIAPTAIVGANTIIQPNVFIGNNVVIGENCIIHPNVTIYDHSCIGNNVIIQAGTVIGSDAFYFKRRKENDVQFDKLESCGKVIIEDFVEIGANCTIDKGVSGDTIIGRGTKTDNLVHIAHGVVIGKNCLIAAFVGIAGKTVIEDEVTLWGQVGVTKDIRIEKGAIVNGQSGVFNSLKGNQTYFGTPAIPAKIKAKELFWVKQIPLIWEKVNSKD